MKRFATGLMVALAWALAQVGCGEETAPVAAPAAAAAPTSVAPETPEQIVAAIDGKTGSPVWAEGEKLAEAAKGDPAALAKYLSGDDPARALAAAYAMMKDGEQERSVDATAALVTSAAAPLSRRKEAAELLGACGGDYASAKIRGLLEAEAGLKDIPELVQAALAASLLKLTRGETAYAHLLRLANGAADYNARAEALLALAVTEKYPEVKERVEKLAAMPGAYGEAAANLVALKDKYDITDEGDRFPPRLINEVIQKLRVYYAPDETDPAEMKQLEPEAMASIAAKSMLRYVDQFNDYYDEEDLASFDEQMHNNYGGIGAWVGMRNGAFTILTPMFGKPAQKAGIRAMDIVEKIDGKNIKDMKSNDIIKLLKGESGSKVKIAIWRQGWQKARDFVVVRDTIDIPPVLSQTLPGGVGYIRLNNFTGGDPAKGIKGTTDMLRDVVTSMKGAGVRGIMLDLTNNPGGLLPEAVGVARVFLGHGKLIVYSQGKPNVYRRQQYFAGQDDPLYTGPLVVLVNSGSASASEIVAGALKDHKRALLVGEKTFGKGSVQQMMDCRSTGRETCIKLTVAKYYLPSGKCIHGPGKANGGIKPDVEALEPDMSNAEFDARWKIRDSHEVEAWLDKNFKPNEQAFRDLLAFDDYSEAKYPGFEELYSTLTKEYPAGVLTPEIIRQELRYGLVSYLHHGQGEEIYVDLEGSNVLMHGVAELGKSIPGGLGDVPLYRKIQERLEQNKDKEMAAAAAIHDREAEEEGGE